MRLLALVAVLLLAGCIEDFKPDPAAQNALAACRTAPLVETTLYFGPGGRLGPDPVAAGASQGNAFSSAFLTDDLMEWLSDPVPAGLWLEGDVVLDVWVRSAGTPAPVILGGAPGEGYHLFNQFGSDRTLQPAFAVEYAEAIPMAGAVDHYTETLAMPAGGFVVEQGDRVRVLLTDLALDSPDGSGHEVLYGGDTPSRVRFAARCYPDLFWNGQVIEDNAFTLPANQGLLTGAVPAGPGNRVEFTVDLPANTERLTIQVTQQDDLNPVKDDVDVVLLDGSREAWSIGSPYSEESGTLWGDNLRDAFPSGVLVVQVNSYSGVAYMGRLLVIADGAVL